MLAITSREWFGHECAALQETESMVARARSILIAEFLDALAHGPHTLISTPESMREQRAELVDVVRAIFTHPIAWERLLGFMADPECDVHRAVATLYAEWVIAFYEREGAFDEKD